MCSHDFDKEKCNKNKNKNILGLKDQTLAKRARFKSLFSFIKLDSKFNTFELGRS